MKYLCRRKDLCFLALCLFALAFTSTVVDAAKIGIPPMTVHPGETIDIPIIIDEAASLAGVKLVLSYDPEVFLFKKGVKTKQTDSLMHVVNDKKPGQLIIVMAGAQGIEGSNVPIFSLTFEVKAGLKGNRVTKIVFTEIQLMSEQLKEIKSSAGDQSIFITSD
jgi:hypothetical protein